MPGVPDFFRYLSPSPHAECWGVAVTAGGAYRSPAGRPYPPRGHPADHQFTWEQGRVLGAFQMLFLVEGEGRFESREAGLQPLAAGQVLLLFPHTWHRYEPTSDVGWREFWIEMRGPVLPRLQKEGLIDPASPVRACTDVSIGSTLFERILRSVRDDSPRSTPLAGAWALELLAQLFGTPTEETGGSPIAQAIARAERLLEAQLAKPPPLEDFARELGLGYSYFRREFKRTTGLSPGQYVRRLRLERARRLLGASALPIKVIAEQLGFSSEFHFSAAFKQQFHVAPAHWRNAARRAPR